MFTSTQDRLKEEKRARILAEEKDKAERLAALKELLPNAPPNFRKKLNDHLQDLFTNKTEDYYGKTKAFNIMAIIIDNLHKYRKQVEPKTKNEEQQTDDRRLIHLHFKEFCEKFILPTPSKKPPPYTIEKREDKIEKSKGKSKNTKTKLVQKHVNKKC